MKKVVFILGVFLAAMSAQASYLFWQLDDESSETVKTTIGQYIKDSGGSYSDAGARVVIKDSEGDVVKTGDTVNLLGEWYTGPYQQVSLEDLTEAGIQSYSYYIEVVKLSDSSSYGYSGKQTYTDVKGAIVNDISEVPQAQVWHGGNSFKATPEPTSAMLMLLGVAGLALKRKQKKA